jgi:hypothetical protein
MRALAEEHLANLPAYPEGRYRGRGVVMAGGGERFFPSLYVTLRALRHVGCRLPVQLWYLGRNRELPARRKALLAPLGVEFVDADEVRKHHPANRLGGWELKVFAALHSPFEELLFLDADCYPCRDPEFLFDLPEYRVRGAIFWPDIETNDPCLVWSAYGVPDPRREGSVESGQFVLHKSLCWEPLNLAWFYNDHSDYYYRYGYGDKHTLEVAWTRCVRPFVMWNPVATWADVAYVHPGPDRRPLFVHRCSDKFRFDRHTYNTTQINPMPAFYAMLPLERECWQWMAELARLLERTLVPERTGTPSQASPPTPLPPTPRSNGCSSSTSRRRTTPERIFHGIPRPGIVVGTYAALPYVHLQLEAWRRFYPGVPLLVHDDGSHQAEELRALCSRYDCAFERNEERLLHSLGDLSVFVRGLRWAARSGVDLLLKVSRRWLFQTDWVPSLTALALQSQYATYGSYSMTYQFGLRSECIALAAAPWKQRGFLADAAKHIRCGRGVLVEHYLQGFARRLEKTNGSMAERWREAHPMPEARSGYALWTLLGTDRHDSSPYYLWHDSSEAQDYLRISRAWGLPYGVDAFRDPNQTAGRETLRKTASTSS